MLEEKDWTDQEKWVWKKLVAGEIADFNEKKGLEEPLDPKNPEVWAGKENRVLRSQFLKTILLDENCRKTLAHKKVHISGARFTELLYLSDARLANFLALAFCRFEKYVFFSRLQSPSLISLQGSTFTSTLNMNSLQTSYLRMSGKAEFKEVDLGSARIGRQLSMIGSTFTGRLIMDSLKVTGHFLMRHAEFKLPEFVNIIGAKICGSLDLTGSKDLPSFDLTGAEIDGELMLAQKDTYATWRNDAKLMLRNAKVRAIQDHREAWPNRIEREGFVYDWLGGFSADSTNDMADRDVEWYKSWLKDKQERYSPQPYEQLADVLEKHGHKDKADEIRYERKERELELAEKKRDKVWLFLQKTFIGYGYRYEHTLFWVLGLIAVGFLLLLATQCGPAGVYEKLIFCQDKFLPLVKFGIKEIPRTELHGGIRFYFDALQIMGYVLVSYLIAGLSGLTKK